MKGMTNALPVLIDASTLATKSDISDMESKTHANATFATKATVSQIQTAVGDCFNEVALGSDGKSLDFTAVDGQVNNVVLPNGGSGEWIKINSISEIDYNKIKIGSMIVISGVNLENNYRVDGMIGICCGNSAGRAVFYGTGALFLTNDPSTNLITYALITNAGVFAINIIAPNLSAETKVSNISSLATVMIQY